jgi:hypothetical protein
MDFLLKMFKICRRTSLQIKQSTELLIILTDREVSVQLICDQKTTEIGEFIY